MTLLDEKHVPIPATDTLGKYRWQDMEVGDSWPIADKDLPLVRTAASSYKRRHPAWGYMTRKVDGVVRLWRIS